MSNPFNDTGVNKSGLVQIGEEKLHGSNYGAISGSNKKLATFARNCNGGLNRFLNIAMQYETRWQFHDANYTTHPEAYTSLTANQSDYALSDLHLQLRTVYVLNADGKKVPLRPIDEFDTANKGVSIDEHFSVAGMPQYYDKKGRSIKLYPAPSADQTTLTAGLFVTYTSAPSYFIFSDTTKKAGIPLNFQDFPAIYASWKLSTGSKRKEFKNEVIEMESDIIDFFSMRDRDDMPRMKTRRKSYV